MAILSLKDSAEHVLVPRSTAAGADRDRVFVLHVEEDGTVTSLEFPSDIHALGEWLDVHDIRVLCVDVATAFLSGDVDSHKDYDVRRGLMTPLGILAERLEIAVVINHHMNRAPSTLVLDRIAASLGVSRAARAVLAVVENPEESTERVLVMAKSNLGTSRSPPSASASRAPTSIRLQASPAPAATSILGRRRR